MYSAWRVQVSTRERSLEAEGKLEEAKVELIRMSKSITEVRHRRKTHVANVVHVSQGYSLSIRF